MLMNLRFTFGILKHQVRKKHLGGWPQKAFFRLARPKGSFRIQSVRIDWRNVIRSSIPTRLKVTGAGMGVLTHRLENNNSGKTGRYDHWHNGKLDKTR